jgi:hypothetical protein
MFRFTIRDVLWLTLVVGLGVALVINHQHTQKLDEQAKELRRESKIWESRANSLRHDVLLGTNKSTDVEFIPNGIRYVPKKPGPMSAKPNHEPTP